MEYKPTVTYSFSESADENLFLTLSTHLRKILQNHPVKWKRSYGRSSHKLSLDVKFLPLTSALLKRNDLVTRPYFHVFWTDCHDIDFYRNTVKSEMASWLSELFGNDIFDWLIVIVTGDGTSRSNKPKISLPRMSLADKIKADFCSKCPERMHVLQDPMKDSSRTLDCWSSLAVKLGNFTVVCLENAVTRYEDRVRAERERRNEKTWNFCSYFVMQEELAFMYEMLCMHEEALIQYNELDAMFTQYLLNAHAGDVAHWLSSFTTSITRWRSLSLWRRIDGDARQMLIENKATLIDVRNYLFARHCHLLFAVGDMKRVTELMHTFLHSTILELDILEIDLPPGAKECWAFMSCMELTQTLERNRKHLLNGKMEDELSAEECMKISYDQLRLENATLWNLARIKLLKLGELCGLMPDVETSSDDLQTVVNLISGMGDEEERDGLSKSPSLILREALSSKENFRSRYLELSELAMGTYKHTGRYRSARNIGKDLAEFYMRSREPEKAESFLVDCVRMYSDESWPLLATNVSERLAECYKHLCNVRRYIRLCCTLMCDKYLTEKRRSYYCDELHSNSSDFGDHSLPLLLAVFANVTAVQFVPAQTTFRYKSSPHMLLHIRSDAPTTMSFHSVEVSLRYQEATTCENENNASNNEVLEEEPGVDAYSYATFSSDEEAESDVSGNFSNSIDKPETSRMSAKKAAMQKNHVHRKRRFVSTSSYDSIFAIQQKTTLGPDGMIQLVTMEEPFSQPSKCMANTLPPRINVTFEAENKSDDIMWAGITCRTARQLLRRQDSYQSLRSINASAACVVMETYEDVIEAKRVSLKPGENVIRVDIDASKPGEYTLRQLRFTINKLHFVLPRILPVISYTVTREAPSLILDHQPRIFCCMKQALTLVVTSGDYELNELSDNHMLSITLPKRLRISSITSLTVETENGEECKHWVPKICHDGSKSFFELPDVDVHSTITVSLDCVCAQPDTIHEIDPRHHRRTHSAPPSTVRQRAVISHEEGDLTNSTDSSLEKIDANGTKKGGFMSSSPKTPKTASSKLNGSGESPVKKFLSLIREVADRVDNKSPKSEVKDSLPEYITKDDFLEVTLEDMPDSKPNGKVTTFPQIGKRRTVDEEDVRIGFDSYSENNLASDSSSEKSQEAVHVNNVSIKKSSSLSARHGALRSNADLVHPRENQQTRNEYSIDDENKLNCNIIFSLPWADMPQVSTSVTFLHLLEFKHAVQRFYSSKVEGTPNVVHRIVSVNVDNVSSGNFTLKNSCLRLASSGQASVSKLVEMGDVELSELQSTTFAWMLALTSAVPAWCNAQFNVDVCCDGVTTPATYKFELENTQTIYIITTEIGQNDSKLMTGEMTTLKITVKRNRSDPEHEHTRNGQQLLMFQVIDMRGRWAVCGKSTGILSVPVLPTVDRDSESDDCVATATLEIMPLIGGRLHRPDIVLQRYLKRRSSEFDEQLSSTDSPVLKPPRLMDFRPGEVLNLDESRQVRVFNIGEECADTQRCVENLQS